MFATSTVRAPKGFISVGTNQGYLRLQFPRSLFQGGKQRYVSLKLKDTPENRQVAETRAREAQNDLTRYHLGDESAFDWTLERYKPGYAVTASSQSCSQTELKLLDLWLKYCEFKKASVAESTYRKDFMGRYREFFKSLSFDYQTQAIEIRDDLIQNRSPNAAKRYLTQLSACCDWAKKSKLITSNPFADMASDIKLPKSDTDETDINPFSKEERDMILQFLKEGWVKKRKIKGKHQFNVNHYYPYTYFMFFTGARPSEAIALQVKDIGDRFITFRRSYVNGSMQERLKTQEQRRFPINSQLRELLDSLTDGLQPDDYLFKAHDGGFINGNYFLKRVWTPVLNELGLEYRKPYQTRHTFITLCLESGIDAKDVAKWVGNSAEIIYKHYAGNKRDLAVPAL